MSILVKPDTKVLVQGITGGFGARHAQLSLAYGTQVVAGVTPGKGGQVFEGRVPIFDTVAEAVRAAFAANPAQIAGIILEPVPGNAGVYLPRPGFLEFLRDITAAHGALDDAHVGFYLFMSADPIEFSIR